MTVTITPLTSVFAGEVGAIDLRRIHDRESLEAIRWNPAPGLNTEDQRYSDVHSNIHVVANDNLRKMNSDGMRFMLIDRPSRMSPYPTAH